jgi:drug/metabolite transporter (DMT)-like permease
LDEILFMNHPLLSAVVSILLSVFAQIALKIGMGQAAASSAQADTVPFWRLISSGLLQPAVMLGLGLYVAGALLWMYVLARWDVSKAYPMVGLGFVLTLAIGVAFLGERLSWERGIGCLLVCGGLVLIVRS